MAKANKITLGKRPETFAKTVSFPMLDGSTGCIEVQYVYRSRKEYAEFADKIQASIKANADAEAARYKTLAEAGEEIPQLRQADLLKFNISANVEWVMGAVRSWNLDIPFDQEAVEQLVDELPAAVVAIISDYREAINEGRLGNS